MRAEWASTIGQPPPDVAVNRWPIKWVLGSQGLPCNPLPHHTPPPTLSFIVVVKTRAMLPWQPRPDLGRWVGLSRLSNIWIPGSTTACFGEINLPSVDRLPCSFLGSHGQDRSVLTPKSIPNSPYDITNTNTEINTTLSWISNVMVHLSFSPNRK